MTEAARRVGLDEGQIVAAATVASTDPLVIVDEAGMLDQDTARAQLPAVGRGGVLDMAAQICGRTYDMTELHRFRDAEYAALTLRMRDRANPGAVFDQLAGLARVTLHSHDEHAREHITARSATAKPSRSRRTTGRRR